MDIFTFKMSLLFLYEFFVCLYGSCYVDKIIYKNINKFLTSEIEDKLNNQWETDATDYIGCVNYIFYSIIVGNLWFIFLTKDVLKMSLSVKRSNKVLKCVIGSILK